MRATNTFSILFWADQKNAKQNQALLYVRITVNQKRVNISLKQKVPLHLWDPKKKKVKGKSTEARQLNMLLTQTQTQLFKFKGELVTAKLIKVHYLGEGGNTKTLQNLIEYHAKKTEKILAKDTLRNFQVTISYLNRFLINCLNTKDVYVKDLNYKFICDFAHFLCSYWPKGHPNAIGNNE